MIARSSRARRRAIVALFLAAAAGGRGADARAEETPPPERSPEEVRAGDPIKFFVGLRAKAREESLARLRAAAAASKARGDAFLAWLDAELLAGNTPAVVSDQAETLAALRAESDARAREIEELKKAREADAKSAADARAALEKRVEELEKRAGALEESLAAKEKALKDADESATKRLLEASSAAAAARKSLEADVKRLKDSLARDFEIVVHDGIEFVLIPAGDFVMGTSPEIRAELEAAGMWSRLYEPETPARRVRISRPFLIARSETTQALWESVMGKEKNPSAFKDPARPVESVAWGEAREFAKRLSERTGDVYRLPTEAEWEYARRAGGAGAFGAGEGGAAIDAATLPEYAWIADNSEARTHAPGERKANAWGLLDMAGNVWEWCEDWFDPGFYARAPETDPRCADPGTERVFRGGCYGLDAERARAAARAGNLPDFRSPYVGFRLVREISAERR